MTRRRWRRLAPAVIGAIGLAFACAGTAAADTVHRWSGTRGPFQWEAHRTGCGVVGHAPSVINAHTRWKQSPANGYVRLVFTRQIRDEDTGLWQTVQRQRRTTKNTALEGFAGVVHWTQWFFPFADEGGATSRHLVVFEWLRDRPGARKDARDLRRERVFRPCVVQP